MGPMSLINGPFLRRLGKINLGISSQKLVQGILGFLRRPKFPEQSAR